MSGFDRRKYLTATVLDQDLLDWCADNLETRLEMACDIEAPGGETIRASDRNKYVGGVFYEALANFPVINRTVGEWLTPELQFSNFTIELSNADGRFNKYLPGGASFASWLGKTVTVKIGLGEQASTYVTVFSGKITDAGGLRRSVKSITITARDIYDDLNVNFPTTAFTYAEYSKIEDSIAGTLKPIIYGDFTTATDPSPAIVPAFVVNGANPQLDLKSRDIDSISVGSPAVITSKRHLMDVNDELQFETTGTLPSPLATATSYWVSAIGTNDFTVSATFGGPAVATVAAGTGSHTFTAMTRVNVKTVVSINDLVSLTEIWVRRSDIYYRVPGTAITIGSGNKSATVAQGGTWFDGGPYEYQGGDLFFVKCNGKNLGADSDNIIAQARDLLESFTVVSSFDPNWGTFKTNLASIKSRIWENEPKAAITYALSLLEQVRLEAFVARDGAIKINSLRFEDWDSIPDYTLKNWDIIKDSFQPELDETLNFNRAQGYFDFHPDINESSRLTGVYRNQASIDQVGKAISKRIAFPNLYFASDVETQLIEIIKLASCMFETINCGLTWRSFLRDVGDFVKIDVNIGSSKFDQVIGMVRDLGYDPKGISIPVKIWSLSMCPFPGYTPGYAGTVGGYNSTIVLE